MIIQFSTLGWNETACLDRLLMDTWEIFLSLIKRYQERKWNTWKTYFKEEHAAWRPLRRVTKKTGVEQYNRTFWLVRCLGRSFEMKSLKAFMFSRYENGRCIWVWTLSISMKIIPWVPLQHFWSNNKPKRHKKLILRQALRRQPEQVEWKTFGGNRSEKTFYFKLLVLYDKCCIFLNLS